MLKNKYENGQNSYDVKYRQTIPTLHNSSLRILELQILRQFTT